MKEQIVHKGKLLAIIVRKNYSPTKTEFITKETFNQQVGFIVYNKNEDIESHLHRELPHNIKGTQEVLILKKGYARIDFYSQEKKYIESRKLIRGDTLILVSGGHGFHFYEDSIFLEVKQGPYIGPQEKEKFPSTYREKKGE